MPQEGIEVAVLPHQREFLTSRATHTGLVAGYGAGKSRAATIKIVAKLMEYPGVGVAYYLPTYQLIKDIAVPNIRSMLGQMEIPFKYHETDKVFKTCFGNIVLRSMDKPENIIGYEVGYSVIDEADVPRRAKMEGVFLRIVARNRKPLPDGSPNCIDLVSTPEGFEFMYHFFVEGESENRKLIRARSRDNPYLPETYFETLEEIYTKEQLEAYLDGLFVNLTGNTVYYAFHRKLNHSDLIANPGELLHVGMDFNIGNMHAVIHVERGGNPIAVAEIVKAYDTQDACAAIKSMFPKHPVIVYPDAAGKARSTSGASDHDIIRANLFQVKSPPSNPPVRDRVNAMNGMFCNAKGERRYLVNTKACPEYTAALEQLTLKNGVPDKSSGLDHITEGAGYYIHPRYFKNRSARAQAN